MIKRPPKLTEGMKLIPMLELIANHRDDVEKYSKYQAPIDNKGRYLPFDQFMRRVDAGLNQELAWAFTKMARRSVLRPLVKLGQPSILCSYMPTVNAEIARTLVDQNVTSAALEWTAKKIGEESLFKYLFNDLVEDEAISSSQLEGAVTTTQIAKEMIKRNREPRNMDERMILGNYKMMNYVWEHRDSNIDLDFILDLHQIGVSGIDDKKYSPGELKKDDDVVVIDQDENIVHQPPPVEGIIKRLTDFFAWVNATHDDAQTVEFIHPLIKAIVIHFTIGYEHPFRDGNGRVARALFYWFMFKKGYAAFRYISISSLLKKASSQYAKSYLYTETDEMDMTYFIDNQCSIISKGIKEFNEHCKKVIYDIESFNAWLWSSGVFTKLNDKQKTVFQVAKSGTAKIFTATSVKENIGCSYNTANSVLNGLVELNLFSKKKIGKEWIYSLRDKQEIQKNWIS